MDNRTDELERKRAIERGHVRLVIFILLIIIGIGAFFYMRRPHHASTHPQPLAMKKDSSLSYKINKLSNKQIAGMLIYYAHLKYKSNDSWGDIYQEATEGGLKINRYRKYRFENYTVESTDKNYLYVIDDRVVYTISNTKDKSKAKIVFGDSQQELGEANLTTIYTTVMREPNSKKILSEIDHNITLDSDISEQQSSSKSASASSIRSSNDNIQEG